MSLRQSLKKWGRRFVARLDALFASDGVRGSTVSLPNMNVPQREGLSPPTRPPESRSAVDVTVTTQDNQMNTSISASVQPADDADPPPQHGSLSACTSDPAPTNSGEPSQPSSEGPKIGEWTYLNGFLRVLSQCSGVFAPLKVLVDDLVLCTEVYKSVASGRDEFVSLQTELEALFEELQGHYSNDMPPAVTASIGSLCRSIQKELVLVKQKLGANTISRIVTAEEDADHVLACYRRIHGQLRRLTLNTNISLWRITDELATNARLKNLSPSLSACYNSNKAMDLKRGACTPGTRVDVLAQMHGWIHDRAEGSVYWLNGMAGTGKTTIAYSLCTELEQGHNLGASFFCSRLLPECRDVGLIVPSVAYQLARFSQPFRCALSRILEMEQDLGAKELGVQFDKLVVKPLEEVRDTLPEELVVVIDALDECDNKESTRRILEALLVKTSDLPIKVFLASRPEPQIREQMKKKAGRKAISRLVLHELDKGTVQGDIGAYLRSALASINPSESDILALIERAGILFIYAATVVRYIGYANFTKNPRKRLKNVLEVSSAGGANPYKDIDELYTLVLASAFDDPEVDADEKTDTKELLFTALCAHEPLTASALSGLLGLHDMDRVHAALAPLWSVLHVVESNGLVTTLHASFPDYMFDSTRSKQYHCDRNAHDHALMKHCFRYLRDTRPQFNICGLESSFVLDENIPDLEKRVEKAIPTEMLYACRHWETHLQVANGLTDTFDQLYRFLSSQLLLWIEVMNLKKYNSVSMEILHRVGEWCEHHGCTEELKKLLYDSWRFISRFASDPVSRSTPHIYVSMLPCWPAYSPISKHYAKRWKSAIQGNAIARRSFSLLATWATDDAVFSLAWSPDGRHVAYISSRGIFTRNSINGEAVLGPLNQVKHKATSIAYSSDGARIVSGFADGTLRVWDAQSGKKVFGPLKGHDGEIKCVAFSRDGSRIASCSADRTLRTWDGRTGKKVLGSLKGHTDSVNSLAFSPDGTRLISGSEDMTIRMWDAQTGKPMLGPLEGHTYSVRSVAFSPDGTHIISGSDDKTIRMWDSRTGQPTLSPLEGHTSSVISAAFSPGGTRIVSGSQDNTIRMWDAQTGQPILSPLKGHTDSVLSVAFSPDSTRIASGSKDKTIRMWDAQTGQPTLSPLDGHTWSVNSVAFSPDGTRIVSGSEVKNIRVWDAQTGQPTPSPLQGHTNWVNSVAFSLDGTHIVSGSRDKTIRMWDAQTGQPILSPLQGHTNWVNSVAFSPGGTRIVSGSRDNTLRMWDARTGQPILSPLQGHTNWVTSVAFSPDGTRIVSGSRDKTIRVWDARTGQPTLSLLQGHTNWVTSVAFSPDGTRIVSGSRDKTIRVWDAQTGQPTLSPLEGHTDSVTSVAFSPGGTHVVSGSQDNTIRMWDAQTGQPTLSPLQGHTDSVNSVAFSPDGTRIVSGSSDKTIRMWDARTIQSLYNNPFPVYPSTWEVTSDGWVVDGADRSRLLFWLPEDLRPKALPPGQLCILPAEHEYIALCLDETCIGPSWEQCHLTARLDEEPIQQNSPSYQGAD